MPSVRLLIREERAEEVGRACLSSSAAGRHGIERLVHRRGLWERFCQRLAVKGTGHSDELEFKMF